MLTPRPHKDATLMLAQADPLSDGLDPGIRSALDAFWDAVRTEGLHPPREHSPQRRRRGRRRVLIAAAIAAAAVIGSAVGATFIASHTGRALPPEQTHLGGPGELLRLDGSDIAAVAQQLTADIEFAPGYLDVRRKALAAVFRPGDHSELTTSAARGDIAQFAACSWIDYWAARNAVGDFTAMTTATHALAGLLASSAVRDIDPNPSLRGYRSDQGAWVSTPFGSLPAIIDTMRETDPAAVLAAVSAGNLCSPTDVPNLTRTVRG